MKIKKFMQINDWYIDLFFEFYKTKHFQNTPWVDILLKLRILIYKDV